MTAALQLVTSPDTTELEAEGSALVFRAQAIQIIDDSTYTAAVAFMNDCAARRKAIAEKFREPKQKAHEAHKSICALEADLLSVVEKAEREAKKRIGDYHTEQERRAAEERRRLEAEARKREEDRRLAEAQEAQDAGDDVTAMQIIAEPIEAPPVYVAPVTPKAAVQFRETWAFEITDPIALVRHIADHPEDLCYITWNASAIRRDVISRKNLMTKPGLRVFKDAQVVAAGRR